MQGKYYSEGAEIARLEQQVEHQRAASKKLLNDLQAAQENSSQMRDHLAQDEIKATGWKAEIAELQSQEEKASQAADSAATSLTEIENLVAEWQSRWDAFSSASASAQRDSEVGQSNICLLYTSPSPRDQRGSRMPSSA